MGTVKLLNPPVPTADTGPIDASSMGEKAMKAFLFQAAFGLCVRALLLVLMVLALD